jgi:hypothetical protein
VSAGDVDPESATAVSLDAETGSPAVDVVGSAVDVVGSAVDVVGSAVDVVGSAVDVVGSVTVASPDEAEASTGAEAASSEEGVASVLVDEAGSVATAVAGSVEEVAVSVAASEVSCVVVLAASTIGSALAGAATGSISTVGSLKVCSPLFPQTFLYTLLVKVQPPSISCFPLFEDGESKLSPDFFLGNFPRYLPQRA